MTTDKTSSTTAQTTTTRTAAPGPNAHMLRQPDPDRAALRLIKSAPAKRDGITNHTFKVGSLNLLIQTSGPSWVRKSMCSPAMLFVGELPVCKGKDGQVRVPSEIESTIMKHALPLLDDDGRAHVLGGGPEGLRLERTINRLADMAIELLREGDRAQALEQVRRSLSMVVTWGDTWGGAYPVRYFKEGLARDWSLSLTWEEALGHAQAWADSLDEKGRAHLAARLGDDTIRLPTPEELEHSFEP